MSERALRDFCEFVLQVMLDQIAFMERLFELDTLAGRIEQYARVEAKFGKEAERIF